MSRGARRARHRAVWAETLASAPPPRELALDPLLHPRTARADLAVLVPLIVFAAVGAHVVFTGLVWGAGALLGTDRERERDERIAVAVVDEPPPPEPEPEPPKPEPPPEPEKPRPRLTAKPPPPPDRPEPPKPPPKIVGVDIGSTVSGGAGPAFATGNDLTGTTDRVAQDSPATQAPPSPQADPKPDAPTNRTATRIPARGVELVKPKRLAAVKPAYPPELRAQGIEADVVVEVQLDPTGAVRAASIVVPCPYPEMNTEALASARRERFAPATRDGTPIEFTLTYTVRFRLSET